MPESYTSRSAGEAQIFAGKICNVIVMIETVAPNPAGHSILNKPFEDGVGAMGLILGALAPTIIAMLCFLVLR